MNSLNLLAQYRTDYGNHMDGGWGWGMAAFMILAAVAIVALVVWLVRSSHHAPAVGHASVPVTVETPRQILDRRLAEGDVTPDEYHERTAILSKP